MEWIDVNDKLPEKKSKDQKRETVIVCLRNGVVREEDFIFNTQEFVIVDDPGPLFHIEDLDEEIDHDFDVIAWMYYPAPYKRKEEKK